MTTQADFKRRVRARMAKTGESYATARAQLLAERGARRPPSMRHALHVTNGDSAAATPLETTLVERVLAWRDALHEGPVPPVADHELRRIRATFLADDVPADREPITRWLEERDFTLAENAEGEFVLWFEADLYDQLQLIQVLVGLGELGVDPERITLICIGEHLGIAHFGGLGDAWTALRSENPRGLARIATTHHPELRFLAEAFDRLSREYPSAREGLSLTERRILAAVREGAPTAGAAFARLGAREARPFLGDRFCFLIIARLANARTPLLETEAPRVDASTKLRLTAAGRRVLDGADDHIRLNGIDRWIGGVHLVGAEAHWQWNDGTEAIVESSRGQPRS